MTTATLKMEEIVSDSPSFQSIRAGDLVEGRVIGVGPGYILVDLFGITTGIIAGKEIADSIQTAKSLKIGDLVSAMVLEEEDEDGMTILSLRKASHLHVWDRLRKIYENKETVEVVARSANKGGLMTEVDGVVAFLPVSQLAPANFPRVDGANAEVILEKLKALIGKKFLCKIILFDEILPKIMVSEREAFSEARDTEVAKLQIGQEVDGVVNGIVKFGLFVTFGNLEGLVHVSEITWDEEARDPQREFKMNDAVKVKIIGLERGKIALSIKRLESDPWEKNIKKFEEGKVYEGVVNRVADFGVFVTLAEEINGLVHTSEFENENGDPNSLFKEGDKVEVKVLGINNTDRSMKLSMKG